MTEYEPNLQILRPRGTPPLPPAPPNLYDRIQPQIGSCFVCDLSAKMEPQRTPKGTQNHLKSKQTLPEPLQRGSGDPALKKVVPGTPLDLPMWLPHHACHAFCTFHKVASEHPFPDFGSPFGTLSAPLGTQMTPRKRKRSIHKTHKKTTPKSYQNVLQKEPNPDQIQTKSRPLWHHFGTLYREWAPGPHFC